MINISVPVSRRNGVSGLPILVKENPRDSGDGVTAVFGSEIVSSPNVQPPPGILKMPKCQKKRFAGDIDCSQCGGVRGAAGKGSRKKAGAGALTLRALHFVGADPRAHQRSSTHRRAGGLDEN